jgi:predicted nucleic acid-binding protein
MGIPTLYLETPMCNVYYLERDSEKKQDTIQLFKRIVEGRFEPYTSDIVIEELKKAATEKYQKMIGLITKYGITTE